MPPKKRRASEIARPAKRQSTAKRSSVERHEPPPPVHHRSHGTVPAKIFVHGTGDCGQLGLGEDVTERKRPFPLELEGRKALQVVAGGMHSAALADDGTVWTWGVNDEGALGRQTTGEIWEKAAERRKGKDADPYLPGRVAMPAGAGKIVQLSAGDSHTMALTDAGAVYGWGTFRDSSGVYGFAPGTRIQLTPALVYRPASPDARLTRIASGADHVVALTAGDKVMTWGTGQQGQLGRLPARTTGRGDAAAKLLTPALVTFKRQRGVHTTHGSLVSLGMVDVAAGTYSSFAVTGDGRVEAWGLNNYGQLEALSAATSAFHTPTVVPALAEHKVVAVAGGQHHTLAVTEDGQLLSFGRPTYGGLGRALADSASDAAQPQPQRVDGLDDVHVSAAAGGLGVSGALGGDGSLYLWGFGEVCQLGRSSEDDAPTPVRVPAAGRLAGHKVIQVDIGGQHVALLAVEDPDAPPPPAANGVATSASAADEEEEEAADDMDAEDAAADGAAAAAANGSAAPANPDDLWAAAVAASAPKAEFAAAAPVTAAAAQQPAAADGWAAAVAATAAANAADAAQPAPTAAPPASADAGADGWAAGWAATAAANAGNAAQPQNTPMSPPPSAAEVLGGDMPAATGTHGAEAAVPEQRADAPDSVADGPTPAPGAAGFTGAAAPAVVDMPFSGGANPAPQQ